MTTRRTLIIRRVVVIALPIIAVLIFISSCGTDRLGSNANGTTNPPPTNGCAVPGEGCPCVEPGAVAECGALVGHGSDGYVTCSIGKMTCTGTTWGACVPEGTITTHSTPRATSRLVPASLMEAGVPCTQVDGGDGGDGGIDPCNPYCNVFDEDPTGLPCVAGSIGFVDGGLSICPTAEGGVEGGGPSVTINTTSTGNSTCPPGPEMHSGVESGGTACTALNQYTKCQQDFRCDIPSGKCIWNGAEGWYDTSVAGVDLTIGATCDATGTDQTPVCNRGSATVPVGTIINLYDTGSSPAANSCLPGAPVTCTAPVPAAGLAPGRCMNIPCGASGNKYFAVDSTPNLEGPGPGVCSNNQAYAKTSGGCAPCTLCDTRVSGTVYDPSGPAGNNIALSGIDVYQPSGALIPFVDGVQCDTCTSLISSNFARAVTDYTGAFTISGVTPGSNVNIVIQSGRWRRQIQLPSVPACGNTTAAPGTFRMPQDRADGLGGVADIPKTAIVTGGQESLECLMAKIGVSMSEITSPTAATPGRFQLYKDNGQNGTPNVAWSVLLASQAAIDAYTAVLLPCGGGSGNGSALSGISATQAGYIETNVSKGGRMMGNHHTADHLFYPGNGVPSFIGTSTFVGAGGTGTYKTLVSNTTPPQQTFYNWLNLNGAMIDYGSPFLKLSAGANQARVLTAAQTTLWLGGRSDNNWTGGPPPTNGDFTASYSFEMGKVGATPTVNADCGVPNGHGRVFFNGMHVSPTRGSGSGTFGVGNCTLGTPLSPEEKALEFHVFQLTACQLGGSSPPPPPPPPPVSTFYRDYNATCPSGTRLVWDPFFWQGIIPAGTSIVVQAATADLQASLPPSPAVGTPTEANVTTASPPGTLAPGFACQGCPGAPVTVDSQLLTDTGTVSKSWLRVYMKFVPNGYITPTLTAWRQEYECKPNE